MNSYPLWALGWTWTCLTPSNTLNPWSLIGPELPPSNGSNPHHWGFFDWAPICLGSLIWNFSTNPNENSFLAIRSFFCHEWDCARGLGLASCRTLARLIERQNNTCLQPLCVFRLDQMHAPSKAPFVCPLNSPHALLVHSSNGPPMCVHNVAILCLWNKGRHEEETFAWWIKGHFKREPLPYGSKASILNQYSSKGETSLFPTIM